MTSRRTFLGAAIGAACMGAMAAHDIERLEHAEPCMGSLFRVTLYTDEEAAGYEAIRKAFSRARELDAKLSDYSEESELSALVREGYRKPFTASEDLFRVLEFAQQLSAETDGAFDITIGPLSRLWRRSRESRVLPTHAEIDDARGRVGYHFLELDAQARAITLRKEGMRLDLGGIAKGYAADEMIAVLRKEGFGRALVAAAGDIAVWDGPPRMEAWNVLVIPGKPYAGNNVALAMERMAVSTSGSQQQHVVIDGITYSHIVDPSTGLGLTESIAVTVVARNAMESDSLATAASVMGVERALTFLSNRPGVEARVFLLSMEDANGPPAGSIAGRRSTPGFEKLLALRGNE